MVFFRTRPKVGQGVWEGQAKILYLEIVKLFFIPQTTKENKNRKKHIDKANAGHNYIYH